MKRKLSTINKIICNTNRLLPFVGFLLVIAGIVGLVFVQKPLDQDQNLRSEASETKTSWPTITATNPDQQIHVDEESLISLSLNTGNREIKNVNAIFNIISDNVDPLTVTVNAQSGLRADGIEVETTDDGYLVSLKAVPNNIDWGNQTEDLPFIKISFTPPKAGTFSINFDEDNTYIETPALAYAIDAQTINFDIKVKQDEDDSNNNDGLVIRQCNEECGSNMDCEVNYRCFDTGSEKRCRLSTNPSSSDCSSPPDLGPNKQCGEYCADSNDCTQGLSCWYNECRNPNNVESTNCSDLTQKEEVASTNSCGQSCSSNADCAVNLRCYNNECRLVTNPSSLTCSAATQKTVSPIYEENQTDSKNTPLKKGDNVIPDSELDYKNTDDVEPTDIVGSTLNDEVPVDETAFDWLLKMLKDKQQSLPTTVILIGIGLLAASLILLLASKLFGKKTNYSNTNEPKTAESRIHSEVKPMSKPVAEPVVNPAPTPIARPTTSPEFSQDASQETKVKDLLDKLKEQSKDQNQG